MTKPSRFWVRENEKTIKELSAKAAAMRAGAALLLEEAESMDNKISELREEIEELRAQK